MNLWKVLRAGALGVLVSGIAAVASAQPVATEIGPGYHPRLRADSQGRLHLLYHDGGSVYYRTSSGAGWSAPEKVPGSDGALSNKFLRHKMHVAPDGSVVRAIFANGYGTDVKFAWRDAGGWHGPETACPVGAATWEFADVTATPSGDAYVFCAMETVSVAHRDPAGGWTAPAVVVNAGAKHPASATDPGGTIHLVYRMTPVYYVTGDGASWPPPETLAKTALTTELPAIALDGAGVPHVVWQDWKKTPTWLPKSARYATGGAGAWTGGGEGVEVALHADPANPPEMAIDTSGNVAVTWVEGVQGAASAYLSTAPAGSSVFSAAISIGDGAAHPKNGNLEHDLATPPAAFVGDELHVVYENSSRRLIHVSGLRPFPSPLDAGAPDAATDSSYPSDGSSDVAGDDAGSTLEDGGAQGDRGPDDGGTRDEGSDSAEATSDAARDGGRADAGHKDGETAGDAAAVPEETSAGCSCAAVRR
ncbi:MAG: hypothetical protein HY897_19225 [Deltaproteobacteria bacterium]|nr:hypothetical protein [Deltaproteobacteria bacterium]